jgi:hypothetical protein
MQAKITLITPPDFFENGNTSILLVNMDEKEQDVITKWLSEKGDLGDINIYLYNGEPNISWFLYAANRCEYKYMNLDHVNYMTQWITGYIMSKPNVFYTTQNANLVAIMSHINSNHISKIETFLEAALDNKE